MEIYSEGYLSFCLYLVIKIIPHTKAITLVGALIPHYVSKTLSSSGACQAEGGDFWSNKAYTHLIKYIPSECTFGAVKATPLGVPSFWFSSMYSFP